MDKDSDRFVIDVLDHKPVNHDPDTTILESLEKNGIHPHYHCREGFCGACRTKLIEGSVEYTTDPLAFIDDDEILPCCCIPKSDIHIQIDE